MITFATLPKPFIGHIGVIQRNAIQSWLAMKPRPQVILFGNEEGTAQVAKEFNVDHVPSVQTNAYGTPLLRGVFRAAEEKMKGEFLCYSNCDIILFQNFVSAAQKVTSAFKEFLLVGECMNLDVKRQIDVSSPEAARELIREMHARGKPRGVCADYFAFPRGLYRDIPDLALGRPFFDNWAIYSARQRGIPVIDATDTITAIHQNHFYAAVPGETAGSHKGFEAEENLRILGGNPHVYWTTDRTHRLTAKGLRKDVVGSLLLARRYRAVVKKTKYIIVDALRALGLHE